MSLNGLGHLDCDLEKILASWSTLVHMQAASPMLDVLNDHLQTESRTGKIYLTHANFLTFGCVV